MGDRPVNRRIALKKVPLTLASTAYSIVASEFEYV